MHSIKGQFLEWQKYFKDFDFSIEYSFKLWNEDRSNSAGFCGDWIKMEFTVTASCPVFTVSPQQHNLRAKTSQATTGGDRGQTVHLLRVLSDELLLWTHVQLSQFADGFLAPQHVADNWDSVLEQSISPIPGRRKEGLCWGNCSERVEAWHRASKTLCKQLISPCDNALQFITYNQQTQMQC